MVFCTEFLDGPLCRSCVRCGSEDHRPSKNSVQKTISCNSTSNAPVDGRMYPKHVELGIKISPIAGLDSPKGFLGS